METTIAQVRQAATGQQNTVAPLREEQELLSSFSLAKTLDVYDLVRNDNMHIIQAAKEYGEESILACIVYELTCYLDFVNLRQSMTQEQVGQTAKMIMEDYPHLPLDAVKTFFEKAKRGKFGDHYGRIDGSIICRWFEMFYKDYMSEVDNLSYQQHLQAKAENKQHDKLLSEMTPEERKEHEENVKALHETIYKIIHKGKTEEQTEQEKIIFDTRNQVFREYSHLYNEKPVAEADREIDAIVQQRLIDKGIFNF